MTCQCQCLVITLALIFVLPYASTAQVLQLLPFPRNVEGVYTLRRSANVNGVNEDNNSPHIPKIVPSNHRRSWRPRPNGLNQRHHPRNVPVILKIIGWGTLLPIGVITARFFRKYPLRCSEWYNIHVLCQSLGYILGAIGWCIGIWTRSYPSTSESQVLSIFVFTFITMQMLALCFRPKRDPDVHCGWWEIYHQLMGYALIVIIIASIFQDVKGQLGHGIDSWRWVYVGVLVFLAFLALALQVYTIWFLKFRVAEQEMQFQENNINS